ncbi:alpha/beta-hydrolase [Sistotremastrum suecicum HHB10207 ss-3]|uniref:Alpha/beta-hydrolase n=1 Tax=Sistotremastrum suecicum HHB10207 ss-3 TaxID=1314776 RepID=A0A166F5T7_9AGAM|nr:alpha/beta-hydrolase [Sistotremastrum suecicum HHB10207 ss-3]
MFWGAFAIIVLHNSTLTSALSIKPAPGPIVATTSGLVQGYLDTNTTSTQLHKWYGVRFAQDTSGNNRWKPPQPYFGTGIFNATAFGPACLQGRANGGNGTSVQSEDCLTVNIIAPVGAKNLPVYVYSFGGGFDSGAASDPKIDGSFLAAKGIVFVSYNYRLSLWAWPHAQEIADAGETQNFGLLDTRAAVEWVRTNIAAFGGDPTKITLGGESVGAEMTNLYMSAWPSDPIIRAAVMQSSDTSQPQWELGNQLEAISKNQSCPTGKGQLACLRTKSGTALQAVLLAIGNQFQPVIDNITIFKDYVKQTKEGRTANIPLLIGTNKDEGTLIVNGEPTAYDDEKAYINNLNFPFANVTELLDLYPVPSATFPSIFNATAGMWRDAHMVCLASNLGKWRTETLGLPVWRYHFELVANNLNSLGAVIGTFHGEDIRFVMGTTDTIVLSPPFIPVTPFEQQVSNYMVEAWTNFIKDPIAGPRIPGWVKYDPNNTTTMAVLGISATGATPGDHFAVDSSCQYWNTILPIYPQTFPACGNWTCSD